MPRAGVILGLAVTTWVFFLIAQRDRGAAVIGGILLEVLLIVFVQDGLTKRERLVFSLAAVVLGTAALAAGTATRS